MDPENPKYFDYLAEYGEELEFRLEIPDLVNKITLWRKNGLDDPESVGVGCRRFAQIMLTSIINDHCETDNMPTLDLIECARRKKLISDSCADKFHEIRKTGNRSIHTSINVANAERSLVLFDEILRKYIYESGIDPNVIYSVKIKDSMFVTITEEEAADLSHRAKTASLLSGNNQVEKDAAQIANNAKKTNKEIDELRAISDQLKAMEQNLEIDNPQVESILQRIDAAHSTINAKSEQAKASIQKIDTYVNEILSEHDFVNKLLSGKGFATTDQLDVLAFPRSANTSTTILQIAGKAGTGKTLCLLAKLIRDVEKSQVQSLQGDLFGGYREKPHALFVCFNKQLAGYAEQLARYYPNAASSVDVVSFDFFVNQLAKPNPPKDYARFSRDVRFEHGFRITYEDADCVRSAMQEVARRHPDLRSAYYLDASEDQNVSWVSDEIHWLEWRYEDADTARGIYPGAPRVGRGTTRRPDEKIRLIILEIWRAYRNYLIAGRQYIIEQAVKRLMKSQTLPKYDVIAIDEVQDFSVSSIKLILQLRKTDKTPVYISGDEGQKIYQRDFTWKELDSNIKGHTITLKKNMRNTYSIRSFADRLYGEESTFEEASRDVVVEPGSVQKIISTIATLQSTRPQDTTVLIGPMKWASWLRGAGIPVANHENKGKILQPGVYVVSEMTNKGLEFDNVIVADAGDRGKEPDEERTLRYVHFTRARRKLFVYYDRRPSKLLTYYYSDFLIPQLKEKDYVF
ncbi:3'-5' exonuclease [Xiamenia xianingshaonis]|uniref:3'-5' exonuclease n=1 Tax=Xiamenia xianingshaonis TaxID=2682776 RepID=UPI0014094805|nr:3'-5' exonuclease [Xiamenia xianingshaonis]